MIPEFVKTWDENKDQLQLKYEHEHPFSYEAIVKDVVELLGEEDEYDKPCAERIHMIDDGDYQGTLLFVIAAGGYQPDDYWYVKVGYGSCSGCDTLADIKSQSEYDEDYNEMLPTEQQTKDYMVLALHIVQGLKKMGDE